MTTVTVAARTADGAPIPELVAVARLDPIPGHLPTGEVIDRAVEVTDDTGTATFDLSPTGDQQAYVVTCGAGRWVIAVPATGDYSVGDPTIAYTTGTPGGGGEDGIDDGNDDGLTSDDGND